MKTYDDRQPERLAAIIELIASFAHKSFEVRIPLGDGEHVLDGICAGLNMLGEEMVRDERQAEEYRRRASQAERLASVGQLAASVAHEINNPAAYVLTNTSVLAEQLARLTEFVADVAAIAGAQQDVAALMQRYNIDETLKEAREIVSDNASGVQRIVEIVKDMRRFTVGGAGRPAPVMLGDVVNEACKVVGNQVRYRGQLLTSLRTAGPVLADAGQLGQVVINLLANAANALPEGGHDLHRVAVSTHNAGECAVLRVVDDGVGMSEETRQRVFEPFFSTRQDEGGSGLGLFISAQIVKDAGGTIVCESTPGMGTCFEVSLPLAKQMVMAPTPPVALGHEGQLKILIIDDEPKLLRSYERLFHRHHTVTVAKGGELAMELIAQDERWDLIVCDVMMPGVDGWAFRQWLGEHWPVLASRVVFSTAGVFTERTATFLRSLGEMVVEKPLSLEGISEAVRIVRGVSA